MIFEITMCSLSLVLNPRNTRTGTKQNIMIRDRSAPNDSKLVHHMHIQQCIYNTNYIPW